MTRTADPSEDDPDAPRPDPLEGRAGDVWLAGVLLTFVSGIVVMASDDNFKAAYRASEHGYTADAALEAMPSVFFLVFFLQIAFIIQVAFFRKRWLTRAAPAVAWALLATWLILYVAVFRPRG